MSSKKSLVPVDTVRTAVVRSEEAGSQVRASRATPVVSAGSLRTQILPPSVKPTPLLPNLPTVKMVTSTSLQITTLPYQIPDLPSVEAGKLYARLLPLANYRGLIVLCNGAFNSALPEQEKNNAFTFIFDYLARCLAANDFVAVCIRHVPASGPLKAETSFIENLRYLLGDPDSKFAKFKLKGLPVGLVGQSEGGSGMFLAARTIQLGELAGLLTSVTAVVGLAPSGVLPSDPSSFVKSILILQGTHDGDTPAGGESMQQYEHHQAFTKFFLWLHGADHRGFLVNAQQDGLLENLSQSDIAKAIQPSTQKIITQNYVAMFFLWKMANNTTFKPVFVGDATVEWASSDPTIKDDFDKRFRGLPLYTPSPSIPLTALPSGYTFAGFFQGVQEIDEAHPVKFGPLRDFHSALRQHTVSGILVEWNKVKDSNPTIEVLCNKDVMNKSPTALEFQAVLLPPISHFQANNPAQIVIKLRSGTNLSLPVNATIEPSLQLDAARQSDHQTISRAILGTVRVPMGKFGPLPNGFFDNAVLVLDFSKSNGSGRLALSEFRVSFS